MPEKAAAKSNLKEDILRAGLAGAASVLAASVTHPMDLIKVRMQIQPILPDGSKKY